MRTFAQRALTISLTAAFLAACGESQARVGAPGFVSPSRSNAQKTSAVHYLYPFDVVVR